MDAINKLKRQRSLIKSILEDQKKDIQLLEKVLGQYHDLLTYYLPIILIQELDLDESKITDEFENCLEDLSSIAQSPYKYRNFENNFRQSGAPPIGESMRDSKRDG